MLILAAVLAIFVYGMIAAMLGTILPDLSKKFSLTPKQNGNIALAQAIGLMIASLAVGPLIDLQGKKIGLLIGLALICIGGYVGIVALWVNEQRSIIADIGLRLVWTGYVVTIFTGMADIVGLGSQPLPGPPYFGPWQAGGVLIGQIVIAIGFLMAIPYRSFLGKQ